MFTFRGSILAIVLGLASLWVPEISVYADAFEWEAGNANTDWNDFFNWAGTPNEYPDDNTDSALVTVPSVQISPRLDATNITIGALTIRSNGDVNTGDGTDNYALTVQESLFQNGSTLIEDNGSSLTVWQSPVGNDFDTDTLTLDGGSLILRQGAKAQVDGLLTLTGGGDIFGSGVIELNGGENIANNGTIRAAFGGTLTVQRTSTERINLDGSGNGALLADDDSRLIIDMPNTAPGFNGTMHIGDNAEIRINDNWELLSQLDFNGGNGTATQSGNRTTYSGAVNVNSGTAVLAAEETTIPGSAVLTMNDNTTLQFDSRTIADNPVSFNVGFRPTFVVNDFVSIGIGAGDFNWDGLGQNGAVNGTTVINPGATLNLDVGSLDEPGLDERYSGRITINSGNLGIRNDDGQWQMAGDLILNNADNSPATINSVEMLITGDVAVNGSGESMIDAPTIFGSNSNVNVDLGAELEIRGATSVINGGGWGGSGRVRLNASQVTVSADTTVNMFGGTFDIDGGGFNVLPHTNHLDEPLTLNVDSLDDDDDNGIDGTTIINTAGRLDVRFDDPNQGYRFDGQLELNGPGGVFAALHLAGADVELAGTTNVSGNSISSAKVEFTGDMDISANATFNLNGGSTSEPNVVRPSANFGGDGDLVVSSVAQLNAESGAIIGVNLENRGRFEPGLSTGLVDVGGDFTQTSTGVFGFEFADAPGLDQDLLTVAGTASVGGELEVSAINGFVPTEGSTYTVIGAGTRLGVFNSLTTMTDSIFEFDASVLYSANMIQIRISDVTLFGDFDDDLMLDCADIDALVAQIASGGMNLQFDLTEDGLVDLDDLDEWLDVAGTFNVGGAYLPGDANLDGTVDGLDFIEWNLNKFTNTAAWCPGDFNADGVVDGQDFITWNVHKFMSSDSSVAVPEPGALVYVVVCFCLAGLVRCPSRR